MDDTLYKLVNPSFDFEWNGEVFHVKKANLSKVFQYQQRARELSKAGDAGTDLKLAAYAIYLVLLDVKPDITEEQVLQNTSGDVDVIELFIRLGFLNPTKVKTALQIMSQTGDKSSLPSQKEPDGLLNKSDSSV